MAELDAPVLNGRATPRRWAGERSRVLPHAWWREVRRLALGVAGPTAVAGTQFAASLLLWAQASTRDFGLFAFLIVLIQFTQGLSNALIGTPLSVAPHGEQRDAHRAACLAVNGLLLAGVAAAIGVAFALSGASAEVPAFVALAVTANLRWAARADALAEEKVILSARSDGLYAVCVAGLLPVLVLVGYVSPAKLALTLAAANVAALVVLSRPFLSEQLAALNPHALRHYRRHVWPRQGRWALVGVISTEATANSHAYLVTGLCGAALYAPLAFGALFCRPLTIFLTALTQIDRPLFARHIREGAHPRLRGLLRNSFAAVGAAWLGNALLAYLALRLFEQPIAARGYHPNQLHLVVTLWFAIMALRAVRNPLSTLIQATGAFRLLAFCSVASSLIAVAAVLALTNLGATFSLVGVLLGEVLLLALVARLARRSLPAVYPVSSFA